MGYYINPPDMSKEAWLHLNGRMMQPDEVPNFRTEYPVCLVDNGPFKAAGIAYCLEEYKAFQYPDHRPKKWFMVSIDKLIPYLGASAL